MCGIAGICSWGGVAMDADTIENMRNTLRHRGPDDVGVYRSPSCSLAHTRLSIIDTSSAGHQPFLSPDGRYALAFNGEVYNYRELSKKYLADTLLVSHSDTEVLLHLLIHKGEMSLPLLRGMFAFAFWDNHARTLLLGRDPFGKKPLYYLRDRNVLYFASEPKAILTALPNITVLPTGMDKNAAVKYLLYEYVPSPGTGYRGLTQVPMGHVVVATQGSFEVRRWWYPSFIPKRRIGEREALVQLDELIGKAVERRMVADVPVGIFLSGGLDSTTIAWYMRRISSSATIHSCSVSFSVPSFDESMYAAIAADALGTFHHTISFGLPEFHASFEEIMPIMDIPLADASLLPTYIVSKEARRYMKVVLDGDGSDELFGGYGVFPAATVAEFLSFIPKGLWEKLEPLARMIPVSFSYFSFDFKLKSFLKGLSYETALRNQVWLGSFREKDLRILLTSDAGFALPSLFEDIRQYTEELKNLSVFDQISFLMIVHYLHNEILVKLDRATMAVGLEARTPFLDVDLVEFVTHLPEDLKRGKYLLKKLMEGRISHKIITRSKKGFSIPLGPWLAGPLYTWAKDKLQRLPRELFDKTVVLSILESHRRRREDARKTLWTLIAFQIWYETWILPLQQTHSSDTKASEG